MDKINFLLLMMLALSCSCQNKEQSTASVAEAERADSMWLSTDSIPADKDAVFTCLSEDGAMKFYCWNTGLGGTCPDYGVICQFRTKEGKLITENFCVKETMPAWVSAVHSIKKNDGSTYYITTRSHRTSSNDGYRWMDAFIIDHDTLRNVSVYDAGDDLDKGDMDINYSISDWFYTTNGKGWDWLFEYDAENRNLYVPQTVFADEIIPIISDRYKVYHFNGKEFVDKGESAHKNLHKSLSKYYRLARYFRTKNYLVRIDWVDSQGTLRYASWKSTEDMSKQPNLIMLGGKYNKEKDIYTFFNDGHEYVVDYYNLLVKKNGHIILKEEKVNPY